MMRQIKKWFLYALSGALAGFLMGFLLMIMWSFFRLIILGYGDSGPSWSNTVNDYCFWGGFVLGIVGGQIFYYLDVRRTKKE
jgi:hypothetical protein